MTKCKNKALLKEYHRKSDSLAQWQINFSKYDAQTYAFDHIGSGNHGIFSGADYYPQVGSYDFRYKSVECGKNEKNWNIIEQYKLRNH